MPRPQKIRLNPASGVDATFCRPLTDAASPPRLRLLSPILVGPREESNWKLRGIAPSFRWSRGTVLSRAQVRFHDLAIKVPARMGEHRHHDREPDKERQRADHQGDRNEETPGRHHQRIAKDRPDRGVHRDHRADVAIQQQREGNDADREYENGEQEADAVSGDDEGPALGGVEDVADELLDRFRRSVAEQRPIERLCDAEPGQEQDSKNIPRAAMASREGHFRSSKACVHVTSPPSSRCRLIS